MNMSNDMTMGENHDEFWDGSLEKPKKPSEIQIIFHHIKFDD